ncbi:alpha/beta hydrolase [Leptospira perolatii]|uniref:Alpha/beta hydrolase n=1 Tax=Leptospira perolatii TaxID=2023191 RepID=A0A2M9ZPR3_9LEPT|nr:alpha/beta hydrolase [Leptospira perolatii]PJZ74024.1 alpha/beta hydrolase [Leptospira perolatii]
MLLFLHGGPGTAQIAFSRKTQQRLEDHFVVVNWDQRGAGRSYSSSLRKEDMVIDQMVADAEQVVEYLLKRFGQTKLFLVGHSWGSVLGIKLISKRPELFLAYIGIGQVVNMVRGENLSYEFALKEAKKTGNSRAVEELSRIGNPPYRKLSDAGVQRKWLSAFHGDAIQASTINVLLKNLSWKDLRLIDIYKFIRGTIFSLSCLDDELMKVDFLKEIVRLEVPVFFGCGRRDYTTPFELVTEFAERLIAPKKEIIWFEHSAHLPNFEEPEKFSDLCISLLKI